MRALGCRPPPACLPRTSAHRTAWQPRSVLSEPRASKRSTGPPARPVLPARAPARWAPRSPWSTPAAPPSCLSAAARPTPTSRSSTSSPWSRACSSRRPLEAGRGPPSVRPAPAGGARPPPRACLPLARLPRSCIAAFCSLPDVRGPLRGAWGNRQGERRPGSRWQPRWDMGARLRPHRPLTTGCYHRGCSNQAPWPPTARRECHAAGAAAGLPAACRGTGPGRGRCRVSAGRRRPPWSSGAFPSPRRHDAAAAERPAACLTHAGMQIRGQRQCGDRQRGSLAAAAVHSRGRLAPTPAVPPPPPPPQSSVHRHLRPCGLWQVHHHRPPALRAGRHPGA